MPVNFDPAAYDEWLSPEITPAQAKSVLVDHQIDDQLQLFWVSRNVNAIKYDRADTKMPLVNSL
jgi:putative SOS response-associated peptidase YedK